MRSYVSFLLLFAAICGCVPSEPRWIALPGQPAEIPPANLPVAMRPHNWTDNTGSGSCVIASSVYHFHWANRPDLAAHFRRAYAGGQTAASVEKKWRECGIPFVSTYNANPNFDRSGDPEFLEWASRTRRGAIIWYFPNHCVHFCGYSIVNGQEYAILNDNNRESVHIRIPKKQFLTAWRGYGGYACTALLSPSPSLPFQAYAQQRR